jgi:hypothetical protein
MVIRDKHTVTVGKEKRITILVGKHQRKRPLGKRRHGREANIKMALKEV